MNTEESRLKKTEQRLREAVSNDCFDEVRVTAELYRQAFDREWSALPLTERRDSAMPLEAARLMEWALECVAASRARMADRRRGMGAAGAYLATGRNRQT